MANEFKDIRFKDAMTNEYREIVSHMYRQQAARVIQAFVRKNVTKSSQNVKFQFAAADKSRRLALIRELAADSKFYKENIEKISKGLYEELNLQDPEFDRNLFKALRIGEIKGSQLIMAQSFRQAVEWLLYDEKPVIKKFNVMGPGPYKPENIPYASKEQLDVFYESLVDEDKFYYTLNFSKEQEALFFLLGISRYDTERSFPSQRFSCKKLFRDLLEHYINKNLLTEYEKTEALSCIDKNGYIHKDRLLSLIGNSFPEDVVKLVKKAKENLSEDERLILGSMEGFIAAVDLDYGQPSCALSPDDDPKDSKSPTLSLVLTQLSMERKLLSALFQGEQSVDVLTAGFVETRMIRALDEMEISPGARDKTKINLNVRQKLTEEEKEVFIEKLRTASAKEQLQAVYGDQYQRSKPGRPVEIIHPDLTKPGKIHGLFMCDYMVTYHDRNVHCWQNSLTFKKFMRHLRSLLTRKGICHDKDFMMNKALWNLTDLPYTGALDLRKSHESDRIEQIKNYFFYIIDNIYVASQKSLDILLLQLIDMIKNPELWDSFVRDTQDYLQFTKEESHKLSFRALFESADDNDFRSILNLKNWLEDPEIISIIQKHSDEPNESIILRVKLRNIPGAHEICDEMNKIGLARFFEWDVNAGLNFHHALTKKLEEYFFKDEIFLGNVDIGGLLSENTRCMLLLLLCVEEESKQAFEILIKNYVTLEIIQELKEHGKYPLILKLSPYLSFEYDVTTFPILSLEDIVLNEKISREDMESKFKLYAPVFQKEHIDEDVFFIFLGIKVFLSDREVDDALFQSVSKILYQYVIKKEKVIGLEATETTKECIKIICEGLADPAAYRVRSELISAITECEKDNADIVLALRKSENATPDEDVSGYRHY